MHHAEKHHTGETNEGDPQMPLIDPRVTVHFSEIEGEGILLDFESGRFLKLNSSAAVMWKVMTSCQSFAEALSSLENRLAIDPSRLERDMMKFRDDVAALRLLSVDDDM